jgi:enoyl-CoA hydratase
MASPQYRTWFSSRPDRRVLAVRIAMSDHEVGGALLCAVDHGVATVTLNRPKRLNAFTFTMADELVALVDRLVEDPAARVIVLAGAGSAFSSGVDIDDHVADQLPGAKDFEGDRREIADAAKRWLALWRCPKPIVVRAHGWCVGWGLEIALHADVVVAEAGCRFFFPSVRNGGGLPDSAMVVHHVGPQWAKRLLMAGEIVDAPTAARIGLISQSCPAGDLDGVVAQLARQLAQLPPALTSEAKAVVNQAVELLARAELQEFAESANATARRDPAVAAFGEVLRREGLAAALAWREERLG